MIMKTLLTALFLVSVNSLIAQSWYNVPVPTSNKLNDIDFPTSSVGYIVGDSATLLKTIDGGETWLQLIPNGITFSPWASNIIDVNFVDELIGFIVVDNSNEGPYKTTDGGASWTPFTNGVSNMCYKKTMFVNSENDFFLGGAGCFQSGQIEQFIDPTWNYATVNYESFNTSEYVTEIDFEGNVGIAAMNGKYFLRSVDGGVTWDSIPSFLGGDSKLTSVMFASADTVYAGYEAPILYGFGFLISTDAGLTWTNQSTTGFFYPAARGFTQANNGDLYAGGITVGEFGIVFESADGLTWTETLVDQPINNMDGYNSDITFGIGDSGYVIVNSPIGSLGFNNIEDDLYQINVYPNPTSDFITIDNEINEPIVYNLIDLNGQTIIGNIEAKDKKVIDLTNLQTGIYYLKSVDEQVSIVHKIIKL